MNRETEKKVEDIIKDLDQIKEKNGEKYVVDTFKYSVLKAGNPVLALQFIKNYKVGNSWKYIDIIINSKNNKLMYDAIPYAENNYKQKITKHIIDSKDANMCYLIAFKYCKSSWMCFNDELEQVVINSNNPKLSCKYVENVKVSNIDKHKNVIIDADDIKYCYLFLKATNTSLEPFMNLILHSPNLEYVIKCAEYANLRQIKLFMDKIIISREPKYIYLFTKKFYYEGIDIKKLGEAVINSMDPEYNYLFAKDIMGADVLRHGDIVIKSKNVEYNYLFAIDVKEANVVKHRNFLLSSKDKLERYKYLSDENLEEKYQNSIIKNKILSLSKDN